ncbi:MAG: phage tail tape measure protein [Sphaerochaeta sp.]
MPNADGRVYIQIDGDNTNLRKALNNSESSLQGLKSFVVKLGLGALFVTELKKAITATNELESSVKKASTLFGDIDVDMGNLYERIRKISSETNMDASRLGESLYTALSAGIPATEDMGESLEFLERSARLAKAGFTDVDTAVSATAKVLNAYGMDVEKDTDRVQNLMMATQNLGIVTVDELGSSLAHVTPTAAAYGVTFEQVSASIALMTKQGMNAANATTFLNRFISELGSNGTQASKTLAKVAKKLGWSSTTLKGLMEDGYTIADILKALTDHSDKLGVSLSDLFGAELAGRTALFLSDTEQFNDILDKMAGETDLVEQAYSKLMETRAEKWNKFKNDMKNMAIKITMSPGVQKILDDLMNLAGKLAQKLEDIAPGFVHSVQKIYTAGSILKAWLEREFENFSLKFGISIRVVDNELKQIIDDISSGDFFGALFRVGKDVLTIKLAIKLVEGVFEILKMSILGGFEGIGVSGTSLTLLGLTIALTVHEAMKSGDWGDLVSKLASGLVAAMIAVGFTNNPELGVLAFSIGVSLNFLEGNKIKSALRDWTRTFAKIQDFLTGGDSLHIIDREFLMQDYEFLKNLSTQTVDEIMKIMAELGVDADEAYKEYNRRIEEMSKALNIDVDMEELIDKTVREQVARATGKVQLSFGQFGELLGYAIEAGLIDGIKENWKMEDYLEIFSQLPEDIKELYGIHSPSKVFMGIGENVLQGFIDGATEDAMMTMVEEEYRDFGETIAKAIAEGFYDEDPMKLINDYMEANAAFDKWFNWIHSGSWRTDEDYLSGVSNKKGDTSTQKGRTTGGGGINKIEGWTLNDAGKWVEAPKPTGWQKFWSAMAMGADTGIGKLFDFSEGMTVIEDGVEVLTEKGQFWSDMMNAGISTMLSSFETLGEDLIEGKAGWKSFARAGLEALASILEALGYQLASMAISTYPNFAQMARSAMGSALAFTGAGLVRGFAGKFENGGIVGGRGYTGDRHMIFANAGELILSRAQQGAIASQLGNQSLQTINISFTGNVFGDERTISEYVYNGIKTAQAEGVIEEW